MFVVFDSLCDVPGDELESVNGTQGQHVSVGGVHHGLLHPPLVFLALFRRQSSPVFCRGLQVLYLLDDHQILASKGEREKSKREYFTGAERPEEKNDLGPKKETKTKKCSL